MENFKTGDILYHDGSETAMEILTINLDTNGIKMKVLNGNYQGREIHKQLNRIEQYIIDDEMCLCRIKTNKQKFSMTPLKFTPKIEFERIIGTLPASLRYGEEWQLKMKIRYEFDWTEDINQLDVNHGRASNKSMKYEPILTDGIFTEVRSLVTKIWSTYNNEFGYVDEKMNIVNSLPQEWTSVIQMIKMFHVLIQRKIYEALSQEANESIKLEMYDRGWTVKNF